MLLLTRLTHLSLPSLAQNPLSQSPLNQSLPNCHEPKLLLHESQLLHCDEL